MWKTTGLLLFHVCVGVIHRRLPKAQLFFISQAFSSWDFPEYRPVQTNWTIKTAGGCGIRWRRAWFRCPPGYWGCHKGRSVEIGAKLKTTPPVINHLPVAGVRANPPRPRAPGFIRGDKAWHPEKWAQPPTRQDGSEPNVTDSLSMRGLRSKGITETETVYPYSVFLYFCSDSWSHMIFTFL